VRREDPPISKEVVNLTERQNHDAELDGWGLKTRPVGSIAVNDRPGM